MAQSYEMVKCLHAMKRNDNDKARAYFSDLSDKEKIRVKKFYPCFNFNVIPEDDLPF